MTLESPLARRDVILGRLAQGQSVVAAALALEFEVSEDAIRRDLRALAAEGRCRRVYGGALPLSKATAPMAARMEEARDRKQALARKAASLVKPGQFVFLDSGSTNLALVSCLPEDFELTIATNSIDIAAAALRRSDLRLIMVGGDVNSQCWRLRRRASDAEPHEDERRPRCGWGLRGFPRDRRQRLRTVRRHFQAYAVGGEPEASRRRHRRKTHRARRRIASPN